MSQQQNNLRHMYSYNHVLEKVFNGWEYDMVDNVSDLFVCDVFVFESLCCMKSFLFDKFQLVFFVSFGIEPDA